MIKGETGIPVKVDRNGAAATLTETSWMLCWRQPPPPVIER